MKLVRQVKLFFQEGTSDKVYEIDLCESGDGYLVNFRYGRRGASLKEGTKTIFPVPIAEAEKQFNALEQEKRKKGYVAIGEAPMVDSPLVSGARKPSVDKRKKAIVRLLKAAAADEEPEHWALPRIIWRAGDLKIPEAIPYIIKIADPSDAMNIYSAVWAVGRCGTDKALGFLQNLRKNSQLPEHTRLLIVEALLKLSEGTEKQALLAESLASLPTLLQKSITERNYQQFEKDLREYLFQLKTASNDYLIGVYQLARQDAKLHQLFMKVVGDITLGQNYFKQVRNIFKTSAMVQDYAMYGLIAKMIEKQPAASRISKWMPVENRKKFSFSNNTKAYLTKRIVRQLFKYGDAGEDSYVELATEILLSFNDEKDASNPYQLTNTSYTYNAATRSYTNNVTRTDFDSYSKYHAFNYILYKNSPRYRQEKTGWVCVAPYKPGDPTPDAREEGFPELWNDAPIEIIRLLSHTRTERTKQFALKVWKANPAFEQSVDNQNVIDLLGSYYAETEQLGLTLALKRFNRQEPDKLLLVALLDCALEDARKAGGQLATELRPLLSRDADFFYLLLQMRSMEAHVWLQGYLAMSDINSETAQIAIAKTISFIIGFQVDGADQERYINQIGDTLVISFANNLRTISIDIIRDLFKHSSPLIHTLAGKILMKHETRSEDLPPDFLALLLASENADSRSVGILLLGRFSPEKLLERKEMLVSFCLSPLQDVRSAVKPIILKLATAHPEFGYELVNLFVRAFLIKESYEGVHDDLLNLLSNELKNNLHIIPKERTLTLLNSRYRSAQLIGRTLLFQNIAVENLTVEELVRLGRNPLVDVRTFTWDVFNRNPDKIKSEKETALKILDTDWDDTRIFSFDYFRKNFQATEWTTTLLITLCDSVREDVQDFAREMITRFFDAHQGSEYLLKLSQHPSSKVQLFTTAYLEQYALNNLDVMISLKQYFITLLSQVNKGKVAKTRVMEFLRKESLKSEALAGLAAEIFTRVSVSVAITERAECIMALKDIRNQFPGISTPIVVKEYVDYVKA